MNKLIYDPIGGNDRYDATIYLNYIVTKDNELKKDKQYRMESVGCTSAVKRSEHNWFYILPYGIVREEFQKWLNEFKGFFKALEMELLPDETFGTMLIGPRVSAGTYLYFNPFNKETNEIITLECIDKNKQIMFVSDTSYLLDIFIKYLSDLKIKDNFIKHIPEFIKQKSGVNWISFFNHQTVRTAHEKGLIGMKDVARDTINVNKLEVHAVEEYLKEIVENNLPLIHSKLGLTAVNDRLILKVLHTKKSYEVESYLAHHMIRAGISPELNVFVKQYFTIKECIPNISFWNCILLTQMGFEFYSYWWLTQERWFKTVTDVEFLAKAKNFTSVSANAFMDLFRHGYHNEKELVELYNTNDIGALYNALGDNITITLKPDKIDRFLNLRLKSKYCVSSIEGDYYNIIGDNLTSHRYKKSNFTTKA